MKVRELDSVGADEMAGLGEFLAGAAEGGLKREYGRAYGGEGSLRFAEGGELGEESGVAGKDFSAEVFLEEADGFL